MVASFVYSSITFAQNNREVSRIETANFLSQVLEKLSYKNNFYIDYGFNPYLDLTANQLSGIRPVLQLGIMKGFSGKKFQTAKKVSVIEFISYLRTMKELEQLKRSEKAWYMALTSLFGESSQKDSLLVCFYYTADFFQVTKPGDNLRASHIARLKKLKDKFSDQLKAHKVEIKGKIVNSLTGQFLNKTRLFVNNKLVDINDYGEFSFFKLPDEKLEFFVAAEGFKSLRFKRTGLKNNYLAIALNPTKNNPHVRL